jgi:glycosyltransferase involved in cell wall biosynthesis
MWNLKRRVLAGLDVDVIVASQWMLDIVQQSPLTAHFRHVHLIPFGVNAQTFRSLETRPASRRRFGIPEEDFVLLLRESEWEPKGLRYIYEALVSRPPDRSTTLLTVDRVGLLGDLARSYRIVELGWIEDDSLYASALSACDAVLMPSIAESFGLMAVEAMAAGRPVICFQDTAVAGVAHAPECGIAVPLGDAGALRVAIDWLATDPSEAERRGAIGRALVEEVYRHSDYLAALTNLYANVLARREAPVLAGGPGAQ